MHTHLAVFDDFKLALSMNVKMSLCVSPDTDCQGTLSFALRQHPFNLELDNGWMDNYD